MIRTPETYFEKKCLVEIILKIIHLLNPLTSKQSNLQKVRESVDEHKFLSNWETIEHNGWKLIATKEQVKKTNPS